MPWKACSAMEERLRFVGGLLEGEAMTDLCVFGISRKTGYKLFNRYKEEGLREATASASIPAPPQLLRSSYSEPGFRRH